MSNYEQDDYDDTDDQGGDHLVKQLRRQLKDAQKQAKEAETYRTRLEELERRETIRSSGLTLNPRQEKALLAAHEGELTPDGLKATAAELGFIASATEPDTPADEQQAHQRLSLVGGGEVADGSKSFAAAIANAGSTAEVEALYRQAGGLVTSDGS